MSSKSTIYRAAIIGCGNIGSLFDKIPVKKIAFSHAGAYCLHPKTELIAACDINKEKLKRCLKKWGISCGYASLAEMLEKEEIDILSICTPPDSHFHVLKEAVKFPLKAIFCEKPIADKLKDAEEMVKLCKERKIVLLINHQRRFDPFYQELKEKISRNFFGKIQQVNCYYTRGIFNTGVHILDLFLFLFGKIDSVRGFYSQNDSPFKNDPNMDGIIYFKNGLRAVIKACDDSYYLIFEIDILGSKVRLRLGDKLEYFKARTGRNLLKKKQLFANGTPPFKTNYGPISLVHGVNHIINCLEKKEKPLSAGQDALAAIKIIEAILYSAKKGRPCLLNLRSEAI